MSAMARAAPPVQADVARSAMPVRAAPDATSGTPLRLQRKCACGAGGAGLGGVCADCERDKLLGLQAKRRAAPAPDDPRLEQQADQAAERVLAGGRAGPLDAAAAQPQRRAGAAAAAPMQASAALPDSVHNTLRAPGQPLEAAIRSHLEAGFGHDFSQVRIHADAAAAASARAVGAQAYTVGRHIAFDAGQYAPGLAGGQALLAHELAHVVQQRSAPPVLQRKRWGACPPGRRVDPRKPFSGGGGLKGAARGVAGSLKIYATAELAAVAYHAAQSSGHCLMSNEMLGEGILPAGCKPRERANAQALIEHFHRDKKEWRKRRDIASPDSVTDRAEAGGAVQAAGSRLFAILQPDILDLTAREVYDVTTKRMARRKVDKLMRTYVSRLNDLTEGLPWKAGTRLPGPGPMGGSVTLGGITVCYGATDFARHPGVIQYEAIQQRKRDKDKKKDKKKGKNKDKPKAKAKAKPSAKKPKAPKTPKAPKAPGRFGSIGFGLGIGSTGSGAANASVGISILSDGAAVGTVSAGIAYDSDGVAVGTVSAGGSVRSSGMAAGAATAGTAQDSSGEMLGAATAGKSSDGSGTMVGSAAQGSGGGEGGVQVGKAGTAGPQGGGSAGQREGAEGGEDDSEALQPAPDTAAAGGGGGTGATGDAGEGGSEGGGAAPQTGGPLVPEPPVPGGAAAGTGASPLLGVPGVTAAQEQAAIAEAARMDDMLKASTPARRAFLDWLAAQNEDPAFVIPEAAWVERMLAATEGLQDADFARLQEGEWLAGQASAQDIRSAIDAFLARPAQGKAAAGDKPAPPVQRPKAQPPKSAGKVEKVRRPGKPAGLTPKTKADDKPKESIDERLRRLAERAKGYGNWGALVSVSDHLVIEHQNEFDKLVTVAAYAIAELPDGRTVRMTADVWGVMSEREVDGRKQRVFDVQGCSEFVGADGEHSPPGLISGEVLLTSVAGSAP